MRECIDCGELKEEEDFTLGGGPNRNRRKYCKECKITRHTAWLYKITTDEVMFLRSKKHCDICGETFDGKQQNIDHCHVDGCVRGVLCTNCNQALGKVKDDVEILKKMITYVCEAKEAWRS